jgi:hypothetical protein
MMVAPGRAPLLAGSPATSLPLEASCAVPLLTAKRRMRGASPRENKQKKTEGER